MFAAPGLAALLASASPASACVDIAVIESILARSVLQYLMIGEYRGTAEMPTFAADVICHAAK
jgi:hypothetical protein